MAKHTTTANALTAQQIERMTSTAREIYEIVLAAIDGAKMPQLREQLCAFEVGVANALAQMVSHMSDEDAADIIRKMGAGIAANASETRFGVPS